ncbi:MAG: glycoside hydrolase family 78 protein, partial [Lachnospiraceae bacterium]|nr:glycoside hydrolase family 78 protein [Lachnospiraceae bacterium]
MKLYALRTSHEENPISIDQTPYFSWKIKSEQENTMQTAYRIVLSASDNTVIWDSGKVESDKSAFVVYKGHELASKAKYTWEVTVWDNHGNVSNGTAFFETAMVNKSEWKSKWVMSKPLSKRKRGFGNQPSPLMFRRDFMLSDKEIVRARLYATCHGMYNISVNGIRPDERHFAPEYSSYDSILFYQTYDVTDILKSGNNTLGMYVGDGWYFCKETTMSKRTAKDGYAILYQLEVTYADSSKDVIYSDGSEKYAEGPVVHSDLFAGEKYDANREQKGWDMPGFDDRGWVPVIPDNKSGYDELASQIGKPVGVVKELSAQKYYVSPKGENIIDFGQVLAGKVRIHVNAPKGTRIIIDHFETTDKYGNYFNNILAEGGVGGGCDQKVEYICDGNEREYTELFSFQGFRYIRVSGLDTVRPEDFTALAVSSIKENLGTFECSEPRLNKLYKNTRWSQRSNMISIPTDCPQREKAGWTGDIGVYSPTALLNEDVTDLLTRWMRSVSADQSENGAIPMVVPNNQTYKSMMTLLKLVGKKGVKGDIGVAGWADACILVPLAMYNLTGNTVILEQHYNTMKKWCDYIIMVADKGTGDRKRPKEIEKYLWDTGFHYGEWLIPSKTQGGLNDIGAMRTAFAEAVLYVPEVYSILAMRNLANIAGILGKSKDQNFYEDMAGKMLDAFSKGCITRDGRMPIENMGAYIMAVYYDMVPDSLRSSFETIIVEKIKNNEMRLDTGFLGTPIILDTLCKIGRPDMAYELLFQNKAPSWLYEVENGATSIWESWHVTTPEGDPMPVSLNHYAFGCVDDWMFRNITGIIPTAPGFKEFSVKPLLDERITSAKRSYESEYGKISVEWKNEDGEFEIKVSVPCNTVATIVMPNGDQIRRGSG